MFLQYWIKSGILMMGEYHRASRGACGVPGCWGWLVPSLRGAVGLIVAAINWGQWKCGEGKDESNRSHYRSVHTRICRSCVPPSLLSVFVKMTQGLRAAAGVTRSSPSSRFLTAIVPDETAVSVSLVTLRVLKSMESEFRESFHRVLSPVSALWLWSQSGLWARPLRCAL